MFRKLDLLPSSDIKGQSILRSLARWRELISITRPVKRTQLQMHVRRGAVSPTQSIFCESKWRPGAATGSSCLSVHIKQLGSHWMDWILPKSVDGIQFWVKSDENNGHITWRPKRAARSVCYHTDCGCHGNESTAALFANFTD
jgi:hypothetical protein